MTSYVNQINIEKNEIWIKLWKEIKPWFELKIDRVENLSIEDSSIENSSNKLDKKLKTKIQIEKYANLLKSIFKIKNSMIFYTDNAKNSKTTNAAILRFFNVKTKAKNWYSKIYIDVIDVKLFAIEKAIEFCAKKAYSIKIVLDIFIFTNCANATTRLKKFEFRIHLMEKLYRNYKEVYKIDQKVYIHWISRHVKISRNLQADEQAKKRLKKIENQNNFMSIQYVNKRIKNDKIGK